MTLNKLAVLALVVGILFGSNWHIGATERSDSLLGLRPGHRMSVGLVLSGGGAKGIAHVGVIKALEENGIPIDYVAGTSMGAIVGGLYASGYSPEEILELILSDNFTSWSTGVVDPHLMYYYLKPEDSPAIMKFNIGKGGGTGKPSILPTSVINPMPMNLGFLELFTPQTVVSKGQFDNLFVPFRCVASDVYKKRKIVLSEGNLGDAIRMSMSFPVVFKPIERNGLPMFDGGIYDNFPVDVMRSDFAPDIIIGVDVTTPGAGDVSNIVSQLENMIIQQKDYSLPAEEGIKLHIDVKEFGLLDFPKGKAIYQRGYDKAATMMDSIKSRITSRIDPGVVELRRGIYRACIRDVAFDSIRIDGADEQAAAYIKEVFRQSSHGDSLSLADVKDAYYRIVTSEKFKDLLPTPDYDAGRDMLALDIKASVKDNVPIGFGGFITSSPHSMIFLSAGYETLRFNSLGIDAKGWIGQSYYGGQVDARISPLLKVPSVVRLQAAASMQKFYEDDVLFFKEDAPAFLTAIDNHVNLMYDIGLGRNSKLTTSIGFGFLQDKFYTSRSVEFSKTEQDEGRYRLGQLKLVYDNKTLDSDNYPVSGHRYTVRVAGIYGSAGYDGNNEATAWLSEGYHKVGWGEAEVSLMKYFPLSRKFSLGGLADAVVSTKKLYKSYTATMMQAPAFTPTMSSKFLYIPTMRSNSFVAAGVMPVFRILDNLQIRGGIYGFSPMRHIVEDSKGQAAYSGWFDTVNFAGEIAAVYRFPFAALSLYGDYHNYHSSNWNVGISFGLYIPAVRFLR